MEVGSKPATQLPGNKRLGYAEAVHGQRSQKDDGCSKIGLAMLALLALGGVAAAFNSLYLKPFGQLQANLLNTQAALRDTQSRLRDVSLGMHTLKTDLWNQRAVAHCKDILTSSTARACNMRYVDTEAPRKPGFPTPTYCWDHTPLLPEDIKEVEARTIYYNSYHDENLENVLCTVYLTSKGQSKLETGKIKNIYYGVDVPITKYLDGKFVASANFDLDPFPRIEVSTPTDD